MPRTRSHTWAELKIGVLMIAAVGIAALTVFLLTGGKGFFWQRYHLKSRFTNVAGLKPGSPVRLAGVDVGDVDAVDLSGSQVDVVFQVNKIYRDRITTDSVAKLGSVSLLGESAVDITPAGTGTPIPEWGYVPQGRAAAQLSDITDQANQGVAELTGLIHDIRTGHGTVGKLMTDDQLYADLNRFVASANALTAGIQQGRGTLGRLVTDPKAGLAEEHRGDDPTAQCGRRKPGQAPERRFVLPIVELGHEQPRLAGGKVESRGRHCRQAHKRSGAF
jgi:phospholipid/cholesterol/gamma-HCH transport system substrate-binding protein